MYTGIGRSLGTDYFRLADQLTGEELSYLQRTRDFVDNDVLPVINGYWERAEFPWPLTEKLAKLGVVGDGIDGYGCPPMSPIASGLIHMELNRGDGSLGTFLGVQAGLAMQSIAMLGSEEQKQRWLPTMAQLTGLGAFALTEPTHGSDSVALETVARRDGDTWTINGVKKWIGNGSIADVVVVWARDEVDRQVTPIHRRSPPMQPAPRPSGRMPQQSRGYDQRRDAYGQRWPRGLGLQPAPRSLVGGRLKPQRQRRVPRRAPAALGCAGPH